jgi:hypothetical protein
VRRAKIGGSRPWSLNLPPVPGAGAVAPVLGLTSSVLTGRGEAIIETGLYTQSQVALMEVTIALREEAIATLKDYSFDAEEAAVVQVGGLSFMFGGLGG